MLPRPPISLIALASLALQAAAETRVKVVGTKSISEDDVLELIGGRLDHVRDQPATPSRASDTAFLVEQIFHRNGFNEAVVSWKVVSPELIRLTIDEGPRDLLGEVSIEGVADPKERQKLAGLFELNPSKRRIGSGRPPVREDDREVGIDLIRRELQSLGYWEPEVSVTRWQRNPQSGKIDVTVAVEPGSLFRIGTSRFASGEVDDLRRATGTYVGKTADTPNVNAVRLLATEYYRSRGFVNATVRMSLEMEGTTVVPVFSITEGKRYRLGEITFEGLQKTNPKRIAVRLEGLSGSYIDGNLFNRRIRQIIATGAFSTIETQTTPRGDDLLDTTLRFEEADARGISLSGGFDAYEGPVLGATYYDRNFRGGIRNLNAGFEFTGRSLLGEVSLADPWIRGSNVSGKLRLFALTKQNEGYDSWRSGIEGSISWPLSNHRSLDAALGWAYVNTSEDGLPVTTLGETVYQNPYLRLSHRWDHRDSPVLPTEGWHFEIPLEIGATIGDLTSLYVKPGLAASWHQPLGESGQLSIGTRAGLLMSDSETTEFPIDLRYFNGGARSVRSFPERELGPRSRTGYPTGGEAWWVTNVEYSRPIVGALKGVAFVDAGGLSSDWEDFGWNDPEIAIGLGIRFDLPVGPVRLEYGHNITQDAGEPSGSWHFAIGAPF